MKTKVKIFFNLHDVDFHKLYGRACNLLPKEPSIFLNGSGRVTAAPDEVGHNINEFPKQHRNLNVGHSYYKSCLRKRVADENNFMD